MITFVKLNLMDWRYRLFMKKENSLEEPLGGDGFVGEDITQNLKTVKSIPLFLTPSASHSPLSISGKMERGRVR